MGVINLFPVFGVIAQSSIGFFLYWLKSLPVMLACLCVCTLFIIQSYKRVSIQSFLPVFS